MPQSPIPAATGINPSLAAVLIATDGNKNERNVLGGSSFKNYTGNTTGNQTFTGAGVVERLEVNTAGNTSYAVLYDGLDGNGTVIGNYTTVAQNSLTIGVAVATGLFTVLAGTAAANVTITYNK